MIALVTSLSALAALAAAGYVGRWLVLRKTADTRTMSAFVYYFAIPSLLFVKAAGLRLGWDDVWIVVGSVAPLAVVFALLLCLHLVRVLSRPRFVVAALSVVFGSNAFFGLAFFQTLYGDDGLRGPVIAATLLGLLGVLSTVLLLAYGSGGGQAQFGLWRVVCSPPIMAVFAGLILSVADWRPVVLLQPFEMFGRAAPALAVFVLGMFIHDHLGRRMLARSLPYALVRVIGLPLAGALMIGLGRETFGDAAEFLFLQTGVPAAVSVAIFAERYQFMVDELTGMVVFTSVVSFPLFAVLYAVSGWLL